MMARSQTPTTAQNAGGRLFLRFFLCYIAAAALAVLALKKGLPLPLITPWRWEFLFVPAALLAAFLTISRPYLFFLTITKSFYDMAILLRMIALARTDSITVLLWNVGFICLIGSVLLFCFAASRACWFSFAVSARDFRLVFSRDFLLFLVEMVIMTALSLPLLLLLPKIITL